MTDAIIVAGGRSSRLGRPKQDVVLGGATLLERTIAAVGPSGSVVVVGPPRDDLPGHVIQTREVPTLGGPVAALAAGLRALDGRHTSTDVLVLACDMPLVHRAVAALVRCPPAAAAVLRDRDRLQPLAARYELTALREALAGTDPIGASMHTMLSRLAVTALDVPPGTSDDVDRPDDLVVAGAVADHMVTFPSLLWLGATVTDARTFFADDHVHAALAVDGAGALAAVVVRSDLIGAAPRSLAAGHGRLSGRTVAPGADAELVRREMLVAGLRRLAVVDDRGRLLGLLCLKRTGLGFCSDEGVRARRLTRAGVGPLQTLP